MDFQNQVAISTGAASGMGLLFAQNFAQLGGNVVMCDVNETVLNEKVAEINEKDGGRAVGVVCDVRDYAQVCAARDRAVEAFGRIDVMANFAGGYAVRMKGISRTDYPEFPDVPIEVFDWGIDVNLKGAEVLMSSHVLKFTPAEQVLAIALEYERRGADICKIVTGAETMEQQIENLRIIDLLKKNLKIPFLFLAGGECRIMRRIGGAIGCCMYLCVHEHDALATTTQPLLRDVKTIRDLI